MATYAQLMEQAQKLMAEAEQVRQSEIAAVITEIREKMKTYNLTIQDIAGAPARKRGTSKAKAAKYRGPNGESWGGGRGPKPRWIQEALKAGKKLEDFAV